MATPSRTLKLPFPILGPDTIRGPSTVLAPDITTEADVPRTRSGAIQTAPVAQAAGAEDRGSILEARYPDIVRAIELLWGYPEMNEYFDRLWLSDGTQRPIDPEAMSELMLLARVHQVLLPERPGRTLAQIYGSAKVHPTADIRFDVWGDVPPRR
jgi:hypothetical protein